MKSTVNGNWQDHFHAIFNTSNEQKTWLSRGYDIGDEKLSRYVGIIINQYKDPY